MTYIHELDGWPELNWSNARIAGPLAAVSRQQGRLLGRMEEMGFPLREEASLAALTQEVLKSSEIEGEQLDEDQVRSSLARRLGMDIGGLVPADRSVEGVVEMTLDATQQYEAPLTKDRLFGWHSALFPTGRSGLHKITVGGWRLDADGPMQVVSGPIGREKVHYQAPAADRLDEEMARFLDWFEGAQMDPLMKAGVAHLWFVTVHPFDDGNGRIARAIADLALARADGTKQRFYSMSAEIRANRPAYYAILERIQKGGLDITLWLDWFFECLGQALSSADRILAHVLEKARFWKSLEGQQLNERQHRMLVRLLEGFEGKLTNAKWATLAKTSPDTALRDLRDLVDRGILVRDAAGGRSTSYSIAPDRQTKL